MNIPEMEAVCKQVRRDIITMTAAAGSGHPGGSLSATEILVALYYDLMKVDPENPERPCPRPSGAVQGPTPPLRCTPCWGEKGFFDKKEFEGFRQLHNILQGHPDKRKCPGVDASTGSLGQGASIAVGMALGAKHTGNPCHVYAVLGDGELQEGIVWEAAMSAAHYKLDNLTFIVDNNGLADRRHQRSGHGSGQYRPEVRRLRLPCHRSGRTATISGRCWMRCISPPRRTFPPASFATPSRARAYPSWEIRWAGTARLRERGSSATRRSRNWRREQ